MRCRLSPLVWALCAWWATSTACTCGAEPVDAVTITLRAEPAALSFGTLPVGARTRLELTVTNTGSAPYAPAQSPATTHAAFRIAEACELPLNPNDSCVLTVEFAPTADGAAAGTLVFDLDDGDLEVPLDGNATPAEIFLAPDTIDFGSVQAGLGADATLFVENRGAADLEVSLVVSGEGFLVAGARTAVVPVNASETAEVPVRFAPARGGAFGGTVTAEVCGAGCGPAVSLLGAGLAPRIDVQPRAVELGEVAVGTTATATVTITNAGAGALGVTGAVLASSTADLTLDATALPTSIGDGESVTVIVTFAPSAARASLDGVLTIRSSDPVSPQVSIPVHATAPGAALEILPAVIHFGVLDAGDERSAGVVVRAVGTVPVTLSAIGLSDTAFTIPVLPPLGTLASGDALLFDVVARADAGAVSAGGAAATLTVTATGASASAALQFLSGTSGCQPRAPDGNEDLGAVAVGQGLTGSITITNVGDAPCVLESASPADGLPFDDGFSFSSARAVSIPAGGLGVLDVGFSATEAGPRGAFFSLAYQGAPAPLLVSATGLGVLGDLQGEPALLEFGPVVTGCAAPPRTATFVNRGGAFVDVATLALADPTAPFSFPATSLPVSLAPGAALPILVAPDSVSQVGVYETTLEAVTSVGLPASVRLRLNVTAEGEPLTETFIVGEVSAVDVLFIVDDSGSMADDQQILADNFGRFVETAFTEDADVDFHLGVTTTDVLGGAGGALVGPVLDRNTGSLEQAFRSMAIVGTSGSGLECGLEAMRRALEIHSSGVNAGFLRPDAALSVIVVTDEEDSGLDAGMIDPALSRPPQSYVESLLASKGGNIENTPILFSLVGQPGFMPRYETVATAFTGVVLDIGAPTWGDDLGILGAATFGLQRRFSLAGEPADGSLVVNVDGVPVTDFTVDGRTVVLTTAPEAGAVVTITYLSGCT
jgi:Abnormal spindle-like microcephaly-assoc'd, ASPM-SPD-2-Hydin